jgi:phosphate transport system protein
MPFTRQHFDEEIEELRTQLLLMGTATEEMVRDAVAALTQQDLALAESIIPRDDVVDQMDQEIEAKCLRLLARQQPLASDLRVIGTVLKIITDVERIGDHAVDISKVARRMGEEVVYKPLVDIARLGDQSRAMLHDALEAFVHHDMARVEKVIAADDTADALYGQMRRDLQRVMQEDPGCVMQASYLLFVAHYLERICDHCTNIAERVAFIETGRRMEPAAPAAEPPNVRLRIG